MSLTPEISEDEGEFRRAVGWGLTGCPVSITVLYGQWPYGMPGALSCIGTHLLKLVLVVGIIVKCCIGIMVISSLAKVNAVSGRGFIHPSGFSRIFRKRLELRC